MKTTATIPNESTIAFKAAMILFKEGPMKRKALIVALDTTTKNGNVHTALDRAIDYGWLVEDKHGSIDITTRALNHLSGTEEYVRPEKYIGTPAESRHFDVMNRPPISKKYRTNSHGWRADIPEWSQRDGQSFATRA